MLEGAISSGATTGMVAAAVVFVLVDMKIRSDVSEKLDGRSGALQGDFGVRWIAVNSEVFFLVLFLFLFLVLALVLALFLRLDTDRRIPAERTRAA